MQVTVREARQRLAQLLTAVERGQRVEITRRGRVVAQLMPTAPCEHGAARARVRAELRSGLPAATESAADTIRRLREERG